MNRMARSFRQRGFGLIEVLVAVLVLALGVMGFAGLQARAVQATGESYARTQAMTIAQDLAERVRLNPAQSAYYLAAARWPTDAPLTAVPDACRTAICTTQQMADFDVSVARYNAQTLLPQGLVNMATCEASTVNCIYVSWGGLLPTAGAAGQCVNSAGSYQESATCIMLEVL